MALADLSIYVHLPWCVQKCPYCDFNSHTLKAEQSLGNYVTELELEIHERLPQHSPRSLKSVYFGGGTPSLFSGDDIQRILSAISQHMTIDTHTELSLEANPGTADATHFNDYYQIGINRLSLGAQSFSDDMLKRIGRIHDSKQIHHAFSLAKAAGFTNINIDLMYGLPEQSLPSAQEDMQSAIELQPSHISWYHFTLEANTPFYHKPPKNIPDDERIHLMETAIRKLLNAHGFHQYETSAYSLENCHSRHNHQYWTYGDFIGFGAGAHSKISNPIERNITRTVNVKHPKRYMQALGQLKGVNTILSERELLFEYLLNTTRLFQEISYEDFETKTYLPAKNLIDHLTPFAESGLVCLSKRGFTLTDFGHRFVNDIVSAAIPT